MNQQVKFADRVAVLGTIDPASVGVGTVLSAWIPVAKFHGIAAVLATGVLGAAATVDVKFRQATDGAGAGAKDVTGKALAQIVKASGDNKQAILELRSEDLDANNNFTHVALSVTVGGAASLLTASVLGFNPRLMPASDFDDADVVQVV